MKLSQAKRALLVAATFAFGMLYASYCSTNCALDAWPEPCQHAGSHDHGQGGSGCAAANHLGSYLPAAAGMVQVEFANIARVAPKFPGIRRLATPSSITAGFWPSGLAPPAKLKTPVYHQISILRI
jgi:hypothetical protein